MHRLVEATRCKAAPVATLPAVCSIRTVNLEQLKTTRTSTNNFKTLVSQMKPCLAC